MKPLLIASNNQHKINEFADMFEEKMPSKYKIIKLSDVFEKVPEVEENGKTFEANSLIKAKEYYQKTNMICFADDSGIEVDALNGKPGIHSARYGGEHGNDTLNRKVLLENLKEIDNKKANFRCVICYYDGGGFPYYFTGVCKGRIIDVEKGENGFGYDPIFIPEGYDKTFAELSSGIKNKISHRAKAIKQFIHFLKQKSI